MEENEDWFCLRSFYEWGSSRLEKAKKWYGIEVCTLMGLLLGTFSNN